MLKVYDKNFSFLIKDKLKIVEKIFMTQKQKFTLKKLKNKFIFSPWYSQLL